MKKWHSQAGMSLVETIIALGILGIVFVGGGVKMKSVQERLNRVRTTQSADALQSYLRLAMADEQNINATVDSLPPSTLKNCLKTGSGCRDGLEGDFPVHLVDGSGPISGASVRYTREGSVCRTPNCGPLAVTSRLRLFCTAGGFRRQACLKGRFLAVEFSIRDLERKDAKGAGILLARDAVEVDVRDESYVRNLSLSCGPDQIIRGIGLTGAALCTSIGSVKYAYGSSMKPGDVEVKAKDCRPTKKEKRMVTVKEKKTVKETVTKEDGTTEEVEKEVEVDVEKEIEVDVPVPDSDEFYVERITDKGEIVCAKKTW